MERHRHAEPITKEEEEEHGGGGAAAIKHLCPSSPDEFQDADPDVSSAYVILSL